MKQRGGVPLETLSSQGFELKTEAIVLAIFRMRRHLLFCVPQKPVSRPTEKQLASWLNATDKDTGPADSSMTGLVFMLMMFNIVHVQDGMILI